MRSSCKTVSLYRMDGGVELTNCLLSLSSADVQRDEIVPVDGIASRLVIGSFQTDEPKWASHVHGLTGHSVELSGRQPLAVLLIPMSPWTYALTWGAGYHLLDDEYIEQGFGLSFGIRRMDPSRLGMIATSALDASGRSTLTSIPGGSDVAGFNLEPFGDLVNRFGGAADLSDLTYNRETGRRRRIHVGNALSMPLPQEPRKLLRDLRGIGAIVDQSDEHSALRFMMQTRIVAKHDRIRGRLDERLAVALGGDVEVGPLALAWPPDAVQEAEAAESFLVQARRPIGAYVIGRDIELTDLIGPLGGLPLTERLTALRDSKVAACLDDEGQELSSSPISFRRWLAFETVIDNVRYCYRQGDWYKIGETFVERIREQVDELLSQRSTLTFPTWHRSGQRNDEHRFCELTAGQSGCLCLDQNFAHTPFHPKFELCDVLGPEDELVHVKWLTRATAASHLYVQAEVSATALRDEPEALEQLRQKARELDPQRKSVTPSTVVLAIGGRTWDVDRLFTLSQLGLLRLYRSVRALQMDLRFADIPFRSSIGSTEIPEAA